ncbi:MAG: DUF748 domain-containing protein [Motiliproteus sp.]
MKFKPLIKPLAYLSLLLLIVSLATPYVTKSLVKKWMLDNGAQQASIEHLYLNIWSGHLVMEGLSAFADNAPELKIGHLEADVSYRGLWKRHLQLNQIQLFESQLSIRQKDQLWQLGPLNLPATEPGSKPETHSKWGWGLNQVQLKALQIDASLDQKKYHLVINSSELQLLHNWQPTQNSLLSLQGSLNGSAFNLDSQGTPLSKNAAGEISLKLDNLLLESLLEPWLPGLKGALSSDLKLTIAQTDSGIKISQAGKLDLQDFAYQQPNLTIQTPAIQWQGDTKLELSGNQIQGLFSNGTLSVSSPKLAQEQLHLNSSKISWQGKHQVSFKANSPANVLSDGTLKIAELDLDQNQLKLQGEEISWQGKNQLELNQGSPQNIASEGQLKLSNINLEQSPLLLSTKSLNWDGKNQLHLKNTAIQQIVNDGVLDINTFALTQPGARLEEGEIHWSGSVNTDLVEQLQLKGEFSTALSNLGLNSLTLANSRRHWQGTAAFDLKKSQLQALTGAVAVDALVLSGNGNVELASIKNIRLNDLAALPDNQLGAKTVRLDAIKISHQQPLLDLQSLVIKDLQLGEKSTSISTVNIGALATELGLNKQGQPQAWLNWQRALTGQEPAQKSPQQPPQRSQQAATPVNKANRTPFHFKLKQLQLDAPATIRFSDESVNARDIEIVIDQLQLANIDTQSSDPGPFAIISKINRFGQLQLNGNYSWMSPTPNGDWQGKLANLELPPFSPYMQRHSGYQLKSGQFNIDTKGTVKSGLVDSHNEVNIQNLDVSQAKDSEAGEFDQKLGMPLGTAISILTDDDDNLALKIPITGAVADPKFGYQSVINVIMAKAAKEGAISYLTTALQPYGALISLGRMIASSASKNAIDLEPVTFAPGSSELSPKALDYLDKISALMKKRESLRLNLCGIAVAADSQSLLQAEKEKRLAAIKETASAATPSAPVILEIPAKELAARLNSLAQERSEKVKQVLLDAGKTKAERLFSCLPEIKLKAEVPPQVSLGL